MPVRLFGNLSLQKFIYNNSKAIISILIVSRYFLHQFWKAASKLIILLNSRALAIQALVTMIVNALKNYFTLTYLFVMHIRS